MNKITQIIGSIFFIIILLSVPNIQATEFNLVQDDIEKQIEENFFDRTFVNNFDIWDLLEFLHFLLMNLIYFIFNIMQTLLQKFFMLLFSPFILIYYIIWLALMIIFPH